MLLFEIHHVTVVMHVLPILHLKCLFLKDAGKVVEGEGDGFRKSRGWVYVDMPGAWNQADHLVGFKYFTAKRKKKGGKSHERREALVCIMDAKRVRVI